MVHPWSFAASGIALSISILLSTVHATFQQSCAQFSKNLKIDNATVWFSEYVAAGTNVTFPENNITCTRPGQVVSVDLCRVALYVATSARSGISMEAWLPQNWTGRFLSTGNGGISGCIQYEDLAYASGLGFSTVGANNGHNGTGGHAFLNNSEVVTDFGWRSVHTNTVVGKQITKAFYNQTYTKSYVSHLVSLHRSGIPFRAATSRQTLTCLFSTSDAPPVDDKASNQLRPSRVTSTVS